MNPILWAMAFVAVVFFAMIWLNERYGLLRADRFPTPVHKSFAYAWLGLFMLLLAYLIAASSLRAPTPQQLARTPFFALFELHAILVAFLLGWWLLTGRPPISEFLNIRRERAGEAVMTGLAVGVAGWIFTIICALILGAVLQAAGLVPKNPEPSPMIAWMAGMAVWKKIMVVLAAMTIEEAFFRGWLQKRIGLVASTILFALGHSGYGQPLLLIAVALISLVIGFTFYRTRNLIPGIIAHGVFDAVQLFVIIPIVFKATGHGA